MPEYAIAKSGRGAQPIWYSDPSHPSSFTIQNLSPTGTNIWIGTEQSVGPNWPNYSTIITPGSYLSFNGDQPVYYVNADGPGGLVLVFPGVVSVFAASPPPVVTSGSLTEDPSAPPDVTQDASSGVFSVTTASFSPPAPSLLVVIAQMGNSGGAMQITDSASHTWTTKAILDSAVDHVAIFTTPITTAGSLTITITDSINTDQPTLHLTTKVLTGVASNQSSAASNTNSGASSHASGNITTTQVGSFVYVSILGNATETADTGTSIIHDFDPPTIGSGLVAAKQAAATVTPGSTALGATWTTGAFSWLWCAAEVIHT